MFWYRERSKVAARVAEDRALQAPREGCGRAIGDFLLDWAETDRIVS